MKIQNPNNIPLNYSFDRRFQTIEGRFDNREFTISANRELLIDRRYRILLTEKPTELSLLNSFANYPSYTPFVTRRKQIQILISLKIFIENLQIFKDLYTLYFGQ